MQQQTEVIKSLFKKEQGVFSDEIPIGSEPIYISAIRGSSINNLEELLLIGADCIITETNDGSVIVKDFKEDENAKDFYRIVITGLDKNPADERLVYDIENQTLYEDFTYSRNYDIHASAGARTEELYYVKDNVETLLIKKDINISKENDKIITKIHISYKYH